MVTFLKKLTHIWSPLQGFVNTCQTVIQGNKKDEIFVVDKISFEPDIFGWHYTRFCGLFNVQGPKFPMEAVKSSRSKFFGNVEAFFAFKGGKRYIE